jgi:capsid assembly protease
MLNLIGQFINGTPWAITPDMLTEIRRIYFDHLGGKEPDIAAIEAAIGRPLKNDQPETYKTIDGVAVITANGVIAKRMNLFMDISGGISIEKLTAQFKEALADPSVRAIAFVIDSPGGSVDGVFELANLIFESRDIKPIVSLAYGVMASAAYLIGAAASRIYATDVATVVGSIGVVAVHEDRSAKDAGSGIVKTEIYRGKYKRIITDGPLTEEGRLSLEEKVDYYYSLFINDIARFRGVSPETVLSQMSTDFTDSFIGQQAVDAGLVDGIETLDSVIALVNTKATPLMSTRINISGGIASGKEKSMNPITTIEALTTAYPELTAAIREQAAATVDLAGPRKEAAETERTRILGICNAHFGPEAGGKIAAIVQTGVTIEQYTAIKATEPVPVAGVTAEDKKKAELLAAINSAGAGNPGAGGGGNEPLKDYMTMVQEYQAVNKCTMSAAMQAVTAAHPDKHREYIMKANERKAVSE